MQQNQPQTRNLHLGLGEAIQRLIRVEMMYARGLTAGKELIDEATLIVDALNQQYQLDLGFDCNGDNIPDTIEIFATTAQTSCCRIVEDTSRKVRSSSRESIFPTEETAAPEPTSRRSRFISRLMGDEKE